MFLLRSENELYDSFRARDRKSLELPDGIRFPLVVRDYFAWTESSQRRVNLIFANGDSRKPLGLAFDRDHGGGTTPAHCEWCHSFGSANQIGLLLLEVTSTRRIGIHLCLDLSCRTKIEQNTSLAPAVVQNRLQQITESMGVLARRHLF